MSSTPSAASGRGPQRPSALRRRGAPAVEVHGITTARRRQRDDVHSRMVKYGVSMGIRLVCFVMAFVAQGQGWPTWLAGIFVAGAVFLPYVAVLLANAGRETAPQTPATFMVPGQGSSPSPPVRPALGAAPPLLRQQPVRTTRQGGGQSAQADSQPPLGEWQHSYAPPVRHEDAAPALRRQPRTRAS